MAGHYEGHLIPTYAKVQPNFLIHTLERIEKDLPISWEPFSSDPIVTLLHHSDCDGEISKEECVALAGRLREVLATAGESRTKGEAEDFRPKLVQFIEGLERAIAAGEGVEFC